MSHLITKQLWERAEFAGKRSDFARRACEHCDILANFSGATHEGLEDKGAQARLDAFQIYCAKNCRRRATS